jgi:hypothetical protein
VKHGRVFKNEVGRGLIHDAVNGGRRRLGHEPAAARRLPKAAVVRPQVVGDAVQRGAERRDELEGQGGGGHSGPKDGLMSICSPSRLRSRSGPAAPSCRKRKARGVVGVTGSSRPPGSRAARTTRRTAPPSPWWGWRSCQKRTAAARFIGRAAAGGPHTPVGVRAWWLACRRPGCRQAP